MSVEVYASILRTLGVGGYLDPLLMDRNAPEYPKTHFTCFTFFYDWRRDCVENAIRLGVFLKQKREEIAFRVGQRVRTLRDEGKAEEADALLAWHKRGYKFDVVAHSMGGLIARYFMRYASRDLPEAQALGTVPWDGAREIDRLICVGTPSFGAIESFENLVGGFSFAFFLPHYGAELLGTMPSIYQLLPRTRHGVSIDSKGEALTMDLFDARNWVDNEWGLARAGSDRVLRHILPDVEDPAERRRRALAYQAWCLARAKAFHEVLDRPAKRPAPARIHLFAADTQRTKTRVAFYRSGGKWKPKFGDNACYSYGDGTVPRFSACADERAAAGHQQYVQSPVPWTTVNFVSDDHVGLTSNPHFTNNLLYLLLERPTMGQGVETLAPPRSPDVKIPAPPARASSRPAKRSGS